MRHCFNCNFTLQPESNFCPQCGQAQTLNRINGRYIISEIGSVLNFKKGFFYTIRELLIRPGKTIQSFINRERNRLVKPIIFLILCSLIYSLTDQLLSFEEGFADYSSVEENSTTKIFGWIQGNYGYANILMAGFIAMWLKLFFRKYEFNFFEIIILLCFVMAIGMLMYTTLGAISALTKLPVLQIGSLLTFVYTAWAIGSFFDKSKIISYVKAFFAYIFGMIMFFMVAMLIGSIIDLF